jgi:hypothetical protein
MLHNILLNAGLYTEIAKQGKFINVILAAGEVTARIRLLDDSMLETGVVSGMAFPIPQGYKSISFLSDVSQQTQIWLGNIPLTYSPIDAKVVGSNSVSSTVASAFFGSASQVLPAKVGRGKVVMSALHDFYVGGVGLVPDSAIPVKAGETFEVNTQGAIYAYTDNVAHSKVSKIDFDEIVIETTPFPLGNGDSIQAVSGVGVDGYEDAAYSSYPELKRFVFSTNQFEAIQTQEPVIYRAGSTASENNLYVAMGYSAVSQTELWMTVIDMGNGDAAQIMVKDFPSLLAPNPFDYTTDGEICYFSVRVSTGVYECYCVNLDGSNLRQLTMPDGYGAPVRGSYFLSDGSLIVSDSVNMYVSNDMGVSWAQTNPFPFGFELGSNLCKREKGTDRLFRVVDRAPSQVDTIYMTEDKGQTWTSFADIWHVSAFEVVDNSLYCWSAGVSQGIHPDLVFGETYAAFNYRPDGGNMRTVINDNYVICEALAIGTNGSLYIFDGYSNMRIRGVPVFSGGLPIAVMSEEN